MIAKYYQDELHYLRELGRELSEQHPEAAPYLAEASSDPSVERLLEGFAFLTGRLREKIDDELPEFSQALLESLFPHFLRPAPSLTIMQARPLPKAVTQVTTVPRGASLDSAPVDGTRCRFVTTTDVDVVPVKVGDVWLIRGTEPRIHVEVQLLHGSSFARLGQDKLRFYLAGDPVVARQLHLCMGAYLRHVEVVTASQDGSERRSRLPGRGCQMAGTNDNEMVLAGNRSEFAGYNLLHEYFAYPERFMFVDVEGLSQAPNLTDSGQFELVFHLDSLPDSLPDLDERNFLVNCVPAVNLFDHAADPIHVSGEQVEYQVRPTATDVNHYQLYDLESVVGLVGQEALKRDYLPMFRYDERDQDLACFYSISQRPSLRGGRIDHYLTLQHGPGITDHALGATLSIDLRCTNGNLPQALDIGDVTRPVSGVPADVRLRNVTKPSGVIQPPVDGDLHWRLLGLLNCNGASLANVDSLRSLINVFNFRGHVNRHERQAGERLKESIRAVRSTPEKRLHDGSFISGSHVEIDLDEDAFANPGDLYFFASVVADVLAQFVALNAFVRVSVRGARYGEQHTWPARLGRTWVI